MGKLSEIAGCLGLLRFPGPGATMGTWDLQYFLENLDSNSFFPSLLIPDPEPKLPEVALRLQGKWI